MELAARVFSLITDALPRDMSRNNILTDCRLRSGQSILKHPHREREGAHGNTDENIIALVFGLHQADLHEKPHQYWHGT